MRRRHSGGGTVVADKTKSLGDLHLFTATELSLTLGISRDRFFGFSPKRAKRVDRGYGKIPAFAQEELPKVLAENLTALRAGQRPRATLEEIVRLKQQRLRVPNISDLMEQRLAPRWRALMRRRAMARYFQAVDSGRPQWEATRLARAEFVRLSGMNMTERQVRRIAERVDACGGPGLAPIDVYGDLKSVPHGRTTKRPHHGEPVTAGSRRPSNGTGATAQGGGGNGH